MDFNTFPREREIVIRRNNENEIAASDRLRKKRNNKYV